MKLMFLSKFCASFIFPYQKEKLYQPVPGAIDAVQYAVPDTVVLEHGSLYTFVKVF